jgi:hypothetical protein
MKKKLCKPEILKYSNRWTELYGEASGIGCGIGCGLEW